MNRSTTDPKSLEGDLTARRIPGQLPWNCALTVVGLSTLFMLFARRPLWHTDLWSHLLYGELIWTGKSIPETEPIMPLAADVPLTDTAWLTQVIAYQVFDQRWLTGIQALYALSLTSCFALLIVMCGRFPRGIVVGWGAAAVMGWLSWYQFQVVRPQLSGLVCFMILFALLSRRRQSAVELCLIPLLMMLWANLHGSFVMGLGLLGCFAAGRGIDVIRRSGRFAAVMHDRRSRKLWLLCLFSFLATMVNPYGPRLYSYVLTFSQNQNLADLTEWGPLALTTSQGRAFTIVSVCLCAVLLFSPRRISATEWLLLAGLGGMTAWTSRMIVWFAPVAAYSFARHTAAIVNSRPLLKRLPDGSTRSYWATLIAVSASLALVVMLVRSDGTGATGGQNGLHDLTSVTSRQTPVDAAGYLTRHPPRGQVFNTYEWGDFLAWMAHRHDQNWRIFVGSHAHLVPRPVWEDYMAVIDGAPDWRKRLERHQVKTIVIDHRHRAPLIEALRHEESWRVVYEDDVAVVFERD